MSRHGGGGGSIRYIWKGHLLGVVLWTAVVVAGLFPTRNSKSVGYDHPKKDRLVNLAAVGHAFEDLGFVFAYIGSVTSATFNFFISYITTSDAPSEIQISLPHFVEQLTAVDKPGISLTGSAQTRRSGQD